MDRGITRQAKVVEMTPQLPRHLPKQFLGGQMPVCPDPVAERLQRPAKLLAGRALHQTPLALAVHAPVELEWVQIFFNDDRSID